MVSAQWNYNFVVKIMMLNSGAIGNLCPSNNIVLAWYDDAITNVRLRGHVRDKSNK